MGVMAILGAVGGTASPIALTGIIVGDMMTEMGIEGSINNIFIGVSVSNFVCAVAMYILLGGYKLRGNAESGEKKVEKFTRDQWLSLIALVIMVVLVVGFSYDVGLLCFTLAMILILLGTADEKMCIRDRNRTDRRVGGPYEKNAEISDSIRGVPCDGRDGTDERPGGDESGDGCPGRWCVSGDQ